MPVTEASEVFCNQLWTPALLLILCGFAGWLGLVPRSLKKNSHNSLMALTGGLALMVIGNGSEYWTFYHLPH
jgi:chromate transport protein ChrA